jgi:hypothetical protein
MAKAKLVPEDIEPKVIPEVTDEDPLIRWPHLVEIVKQYKTEGWVNVTVHKDGSIICC